MLHLLLDVIAGPAFYLIFFWPVWVIALVIIAVVVTAVIIRKRKKKNKK